MSGALLKYGEVARVNLRSSWAYVWDRLLSQIHLVIIMFVFVQLWKVAYGSASGPVLKGFTLPQIVWYLVATEAIVMSLPRIHSILESEVKNGDLAIRLNKPYHYLLFHYSAFIGESLLRLATTLLAGGVTAYLLVGGIHFQWLNVVPLFVLYLTTQAMHFCYNASIGLAAFWMEDVSGLFLFVDKFKWMAGSMFLPIGMYPAGVRRVMEVLPFQYMIGAPAELFVNFSWAGAEQLILRQLPWLLVFGAICAGIYRLGVRRVDLNGG